MATYRHKIKRTEVCEVEAYAAGVEQAGKSSDGSGEFVVTPMGSKSYLSDGDLIVRYRGATNLATIEKLLRVWEPA